MTNLYKSEQWNSLGKIDRAQLLLVIEGLKRGTIIEGNRTSFVDILQKTGLTYTLNTDSYRLDPVFVVARPEDLQKQYRIAFGTIPTACCENRNQYILFHHAHSS